MKEGFWRILPEFKPFIHPRVFSYLDGSYQKALGMLYKGDQMEPKHLQMLKSSGRIPNLTPPEQLLIGLVDDDIITAALETVTKQEHGTPFEISSEEKIVRGTLADIARISLRVAQWSYNHKLPTDNPRGYRPYHVLTEIGDEMKSFGGITNRDNKSLIRIIRGNTK